MLPPRSHCADNLPNRDCAAMASAGEICCVYAADGRRCNLLAQDQGCKHGMWEYREQFVRPFARLLAQYEGLGVPVAVILEPDSLPNLVTNGYEPRGCEPRRSEHRRCSHDATHPFTRTPSHQPSSPPRPLLLALSSLPLAAVTSGAAPRPSWPIPKGSPFPSPTSPPSPHAPPSTWTRATAAGWVGTGWPPPSSSSSASISASPRRSSVDSPRTSQTTSSFEADPKALKQSQKLSHAASITAACLMRSVPCAACCCLLLPAHYRCAVAAACKI